MIEVVVWDLGGVVAHFDPGPRLAALAEATGLPEAVIDDAIWRSGLDDRASAGDLGADETWAAVQDALGGRLGRAGLTRAWTQAFEPDRGVLAIIDRLPLPNALLSNNGPILEACLDEHLAEVRDRFDAILLSWRLSAMKPAPAAFARAAECLARAPEELILVDDEAANVRAAVSCGWHAIRFTTTAAFAQHLAEAGVPFRVCRP